MRAASADEKTLRILETRAELRGERNCEEGGTARRAGLRGERDCEEHGTARSTGLREGRPNSDSARGGKAAPRFPFSCVPLAVPVP